MSLSAPSSRLDALTGAIAAGVVRLVMEAIDLDTIVGSIDVNALVERVDVESIIERVDIDAIVQRIDIQAIVDRLDINEIANSIDIDSMLRRTEIGGVIARSTGSIFTEVLDVVRSQGVGLDDFLARWVNRIFHRGRPVPDRPGEQSSGDARDEDPQPDGAAPPLPPQTGAVVATDQAPRSGSSIAPDGKSQERQGHYAGAVSRLVAFALDVGVTWGLFTIATAALSFTVRLVSGHSFTFSHPFVVGFLYLGWTFVYFSYQWALAGRTLGMAVLGVKVVKAQDGSVISGKQALLRTVAFPLAILTLGIGFLGILLGRERRAVYDRIAKTAVVYSWDARAAHLRWLARTAG